VAEFHLYYTARLSSLDILLHLECRKSELPPGRGGVGLIFQKKRGPGAISPGPGLRGKTRGGKLYIKRY